MKTRTLFVAGLAALLSACSQKQTVVSVPVSTIDVESLKDSIDYDMDITGLSLADLRVLRNAPAARIGFPFKDAYIRGVYSGTTWYDSLMYDFDNRTNFSGVKKIEDESWLNYYYRAAEETGMLKFSEQEKTFMDRVKQREDDLLKHNFDVPEGIRVNVGNLVNPKQLKNFDSLLCQHLAEEGFAIVPATHDQLFNVYEKNDYSEFPNFVTTDLYLQLYHLYFDCMLRELEEHGLYQLMTDFSAGMLAAMKQINAHSDESSLMARLSAHNVTFFKVACALFAGQTTSDDPIAAEEIAKATDATNNFSSLMADYKDIEFAYSLFRPRGHYTRSKNLQNYFRGMMWLQTAAFGLNHDDEIQEAVIIACALNGNQALFEKYERLNQLITFLLGKSDNLSIPQVMTEVKKTGKPMTELVGDTQAMSQLKQVLDEMGNKQTRIRPKFERTSHNKICIMPQRYMPDAETLQEMVDYDNKPTLRGTPKGLDVFAAMGISTAEQILIEEGQKWKDFELMLQKMKKRMGEIDWQETIANQWMNTLTTLTSKADDAPYFMLNPEWNKKDLNAMLASWAELKHDAILYAKQPFGAECGGGGPPEPLVVGYVEPNISFWKKAIELLDNTEKLLKEQNLLTEKIASATTRIREEALFLLAVSEKELSGKPISDEEYEQIEYIGATFENISLDLVREPDQYLMGWSDVQGADKKIALVADVYTANADNNPDKSILFEAIGNADEIFVVVEIGGCLYLTRGAVFSYREFIQPIDQPRLTDEEWQEQIKENPRKGVPEWMKSITVPLKNQPEPNEEIFYSSGC